MVMAKYQMVSDIAAALHMIRSTIYRYIDARRALKVVDIYFTLLDALALVQLQPYLNNLKPIADYIELLFVLNL